MYRVFFTGFVLGKTSSFYDDVYSSCEQEAIDTVKAQNELLSYLKILSVEIII